MKTKKIDPLDEADIEINRCLGDIPDMTSPHDYMVGLTRYMRQRGYKVELDRDDNIISKP